MAIEETGDYKEASSILKNAKKIEEHLIKKLIETKIEENNQIKKELEK